MAYSGTVVHSYHGTAGTAMDTVNLSVARSSVTITNRGAVDIYVKLPNMGTAAPTVGGDNTLIVEDGTAKTINSQNEINAVRVIASAASVYSVEAVV